MLRLVKKKKKYLPAFVQVMDDYISDDNHFGRGGIDPLIQAIQDNKADEYLQKLADYEHEEKLPDGYVPESRYWLLDDNEFIGSFSIRHRLTPKLEQWGGHIAANIAPKHRGEYSGFIGIKLCLAQAAKFGLKRVLMTCDVNNNASYRAILGLMKMYGGEQISDSFVDGHGEHRVWVNTIN